MNGRPNCARRTIQVTAIFIRSQSAHQRIRFFIVTASMSTVLIDVVFPIAVVALYIWLLRHMGRSGVEKPPFVRLFILIGSYACVIWFTLNFYFPSTGVAEYTVAPLLFVGTPVIIVIAFLSYAQRKESVFHRAAYVASIFYVFALMLLILLLSTRCPPYRGGPP